MKSDRDLEGMVNYWTEYFRDHPEIDESVEGKLKHDLINMICAYRHYRDRVNDLEDELNALREKSEPGN